MNVTKPRPDDHNLLYLFVIGGITFNEVKEIRETVKQLRPNAEVCVCLFLYFDLIEQAEHFVFYVNKDTLSF